MKLTAFDYTLPVERIAQSPAHPRDSARLLVCKRTSRRCAHRRIPDLVDELYEGDVLVVNNSKVIPARLRGKKATGGKAEIFLLRKHSARAWECLVRAKHIRTGMRVLLPGSAQAEVIRRIRDKVFVVSFSRTGKTFESYIEAYGETPTPPYIKRKSSRADYQTIYASDEKKGSVAAPTAGLHFTRRLMQKIQKKGIQIERVTLHVGLGTFEPVEVDDITTHRIHTEYAELDEPTYRRIVQAKREGRRIIAVGTTSVRVLESLVAKKIRNRNSALHGLVNIFIYPGFRFYIVDGMLTNFHLPKSTLLMLVSAFAGRTKILNAYRRAIKQKYRFYSFGDAMLLL